jgi:hypothetical protein
MASLLWPSRGLKQAASKGENSSVEGTKDNATQHNFWRLIIHLMLPSNTGSTGKYNQSINQNARPAMSKT